MILMSWVVPSSDMTVIVSVFMLGLGVGALAGGFGSAVWEELNDAGIAAPRILRVGLPDRYVTHGKPALLHAEVGFTGKAIAQRVLAALTAGDLEPSTH